MGAWQRVYAMLHQFSMTLRTEILSTVTSDFLKQIIILKSFDSVKQGKPSSDFSLLGFPSANLDASLHFSNKLINFNLKYARYVTHLSLERV